MLRTTLPHLQLEPVIVAGSIILSLLSTPLSSWAQVNASSNYSSEQIQIRFEANPNPPDRGSPPSEGAGSRGPCLSKDSPLPTRLTGDYQTTDLTVSGHPTFWVYIPPTTSTQKPQGEFSLHESDGEKDIYRTNFPLPDKPGIVSIALPATEKPLEVGKNYHWFFEIKCPNDTSESSTAEVMPQEIPFVEGLVRRVTPSTQLEEELTAAQTPLERVAAYAKHGIWYETLTELAQLRLAQPNNPTFKNVWIELLSDEAIGLEEVARESISNTITFIPARD